MVARIPTVAVKLVYRGMVLYPASSELAVPKDDLDDPSVHQVRQVLPEVSRAVVRLLAQQLRQLAAAVDAAGVAVGLVQLVAAAVAVAPAGLCVPVPSRQACDRDLLACAQVLNQALV